MRRPLAVLFAAMMTLAGCAAPEEELVPTGTDTRPSDCCVALTFDDGPSPVCTPILLDGLRERGVHATFFLIGEKIAGQESLVLRMQAEGHQIGNHSYDHAMLQKTDTASALRDLTRCDQLLQQLLGDGTYWVRPPYGLISREELSAIRAPLLHWSVDTRDWELRSTDQVLDIILRETGDGDVILLHDCYPTSVEAALRAVDRLQAQGVRFVTVEELFKDKGVSAQNGVLYKCPGATHPPTG